MIPPMASARFIRPVTATFLVVALGALATGLPSHSHHDDEGAAGVSVSADHHSHGIGLIDQELRVPTGSPQLLAARVGTLAVLVDLGTEICAAVTSEDPRPRERDPPCHPTRAPPSLV